MAQDGGPEVPAKDGGGTRQVHAELDQRDEPDKSGEVDELPIDAARLFEQAAEQTRMALCITDPNQPDDPIVYVNQAFTEITGYPREEAVGRNCRFLQGVDTDPATVARIRQALDQREVRVVEILNYRKDGTPFWNALHIGPILDEDGRLTHHYGSQWDITELLEEREKVELGRKVAEELQHRTRNLFAVLAAIVRISAQGETDVPRLTRNISERIAALGRAHDVSIASGGAPETDLHALVEAILRPYRAGGGGRIEIGGPAHVLPRETVTPLGVALHELATNALKYGALSEAGGSLRVDWRRDGSGLTIEWIEAGGGGPAPGARDGTGSRIVRSVMAAAGGTIRTDRIDGGMRVTLTL